VRRERQVSNHREQMPRACRATYERAMAGKSRKAAMAAFCAECMGWQVAEVFRCTDRGCPLYPYRPLSRAMQDVRQGSGDGAGSTNGGRRVLCHG
jgi:hypothetical protein